MFDECQESHVSQESDHFAILLWLWFPSQHTLSCRQRDDLDVLWKGDLLLIIISRIIISWHPILMLQKFFLASLPPLLPSKSPLILILTLRRLNKVWIHFLTAITLQLTDRVKRETEKRRKEKSAKLRGVRRVKHKESKGIEESQPQGWQESEWKVRASGLSLFPSVLKAVTKELQGPKWESESERPWIKEKEQVRNHLPAGHVLSSLHALGPPFVLRQTKYNFCHILFVFSLLTTAPSLPSIICVGQREREQTNSTKRNDWHWFSE